MVERLQEEEKIKIELQNKSPEELKAYIEGRIKKIIAIKSNRNWTNNRKQCIARRPRKEALIAAKILYGLTSQYKEIEQNVDMRLWTETSAQRKERLSQIEYISSEKRPKEERYSGGYIDRKGRKDIRIDLIGHDPYSI